MWSWTGEEFLIFINIFILACVPLWKFCCILIFHLYHIPEDCLLKKQNFYLLGNFLKDVQMIQTFDGEFVSGFIVMLLDFEWIVIVKWNLNYDPKIKNVKKEYHTRTSSSIMLSPEQDLVENCPEIRDFTNLLTYLSGWQTFYVMSGKRLVLILNKLKTISL